MARPSFDFQTTAKTLLVGTAGGLAFWVLDMPLAFLSGSAAAVAACALASLKVGLNNRMRDAFITLLGITLGSTVTPMTLALLPRWPLTMIGLALAMFSIMWSGALYLEKVHGLDRATARLASMPGALSFVMTLALESSADARRVAIIQIVRLSAILLLLPSFVTLIGGKPGAAFFQPAGDIVKPLQLVFVIAAGFAGAEIFKRLGTPAPALFGGMLIAALLYGPGLVSTAMPQPLVLVTFLVLGSMIGANFAGADFRLFLVMLVAGLGSLVVVSLVALAWAAPLAWIVDMPVLQVWLGYAPGGVETTALLAMSLGLDAAFVSAHHLMRVVILNFTVPIWIAPFMPRRRD